IAGLRRAPASVRTRFPCAGRRRTRKALLRDRRWSRMSSIAAVRPAVVSAVVLGFLLALLEGCGGGRGAPAPPLQTVVVATVVQKDTPIYGEWVATLDGSVNAQIQPRVPGYVILQNYTEGSLVKKGQVLFEIDPRPFTAALDQAKAQ